MTKINVAPSFCCSEGMVDLRLGFLTERFLPLNCDHIKKRLIFLPVTELHRLPSWEFCGGDNHCRLLLSLGVHVNVCGRGARSYVPSIAR